MKKAIKEAFTKSQKILKSKLPWCGVVHEHCCAGLKVNKGLYTQCPKKSVKDSRFCAVCEKRHTEYGTVDDRMSVSAMEYVDKRGKKVKSVASIKGYAKREELEEMAKEYEMTIPEGNWVSKKKAKKVEKKEAPKAKKVDEKTVKEVEKSCETFDELVEKMEMLEIEKEVEKSETEDEEYELMSETCSLCSGVESVMSIND